MKILTKTIVSSCFLLVLAGCDTVEDSYSVGPKPKENEILSLDRSQLSFKPDGETFDINISSIARWEVSMNNNNAGQFSVSPTSGKGSGTVTVTCNPNSTQNSYNAELVFSPLNFEMEPVKVSLSQSNATFSIDRLPSSEPVPEEGGSVTMTAYSSLDWEIAVLPHDADGNTGNIEWLSVTPGLSGVGGDGNTPIEYRFTWSPNYTDKERTIRLQLKPATDMNLSSLPQPFTLTQLAGTLPQSVRVILDHLDLVDADLTLEYSSRSPVKDCGLNVYKIDGGVESLLNSYRPDAGSFALNGSYKISLRDLPENSTFKIVPFVVNEVGASNGDPREISTATKPENMVYQGVSIVNADNGGIIIDSEMETAAISITVKSDVAPLAPDCIASASLTVGGKSIAGTSQKISDDSWLYVYKVSDLKPNTEYQYSFEVVGNDLPRNLGRVLSNSAMASGKFKTKGKTPEYDDNNKPNVGE